MNWRIHHRAETVSTNQDAWAGVPGDVYTADYQTGGRGRLDHEWLSPPGTNLLMSVVLGVEDLPPNQVATLPLVIGLAVANAVSEIWQDEASCPRSLSAETEQDEASCPQSSASRQSPTCVGRTPSSCQVRLKWPNDVLVNGRKLAGILCERQGDRVIAGIGVNVGQTAFDPKIAEKATSLGVLIGPCGACPPVDEVREKLLDRIGAMYELWRRDGFGAVYPQIVAIDFLRGQTLSVLQTDDDAVPVSGFCGGIRPDGSLDVGGRPIYAGEAHVVQK